VTLLGDSIHFRAEATTSDPGPMMEESGETADLAVADPNETIYLIQVNAPVRRKVAVIAAQPWEHGFRSGALGPTRGR
jgi:hypothetical protein